MIKSSLKLLGKLYRGKGKTILEAIENLQPDVARGIGILTLAKGDISKEKILQSRTVTGVWGKVSRLNKEIAIKNASQLFDKELFDGKS